MHHVKHLLKIVRKRVLGMYFTLENYVAGPCWALSTTSSVVMPMISFARFKLTQEIFPMLSWTYEFASLSLSMDKSLVDQQDNRR